MHTFLLMPSWPTTSSVAAPTNADPIHGIGRIFYHPYLHGLPCVSHTLYRHPRPLARTRIPRQSSLRPFWTTSPSARRSTHTSFRLPTAHQARVYSVTKREPRVATAFPTLRELAAHLCMFLSHPDGQPPFHAHIVHEA